METDKKQVQILHYDLTFDLCKNLNKDDLFFYFFRKWTQNLGSTTLEKSQNAEKLFSALKENDNLTKEDKNKLLKQLLESLDTERCIHLNYAKGLEYRFQKLKESL